MVYMEKAKILAALSALMIIVFPSTLNAANAIYSQDGSPYLANGTSTTGVNFIDSMDDASYNITSAITNTVYSFPNLVLNGNFTAGSGTNWVYAENDPSGRASSAFLAAGGDTEPGRWRFRLTDGSNTGSFTANGNLTNAGALWDGTLPEEAQLNFSFLKSYSGTLGPTTNAMAIYLLRPDGSQVLVWENLTLYDGTAFSRVSVPIGAGNFTSAGTYRIRLFNRVVSPFNGRPTTDNYWDQVALVLKKSEDFYAFGEWHNSSSVTVPANPNDIQELNVSIRFMADAPFMPALEIFDFASSSWSAAGCTIPSIISANTWYDWRCIVSSSPQNFISSDGSKRVLVRLYSPDTGLTRYNVSSDYLAYNVTYAVVGPFVTTNKPAYSACGTVYYEARFFDRDEALYALPATANITISNTSGVLLDSGISVTGGIYQGSYSLPTGANAGNWLIRALSGALGKKYFYVGSGNSDVWKIEMHPSATKGVYYSGEIIPFSFNVVNLKGMGVPGLAPNGNLLLKRDSAPYLPAIIAHGNGTYSFNLDFAALTTGASHTLTVMANSSNVNVSASIGFYVG